MLVPGHSVRCDEPTPHGRTKRTRKSARLRGTAWATIDRRRRPRLTTPLIDATEMYLRTVWELEEEGITPIRARLVERLGLSAPAVSETVARMEHEGLVHVWDNRTLELSEHGRTLAM